MRAPRAVLLDLDGTLYHQSPVRALMALTLVGASLTHERRQAPQLWRALRVFRNVREELRALGQAADLLEDLQYREAAGRAGVSELFMRLAVADWILTRPLPHVRRFMRKGVLGTLERLRAQGIRVGVFSDYPVENKLEAMGLTSLVDLTLCATDSDINAFKPHGAGFLRACTLWNLVPAEVLYVGDRPEVDAAGALTAGMKCAIFGGRRANGEEYVTLATFEELGELVMPAAALAIAR